MSIIPFQKNQDHYEEESKVEEQNHLSYDPQVVNSSPSFHSIKNYFDCLLKIYPLIDKMREDAKSDFTEFKKIISNFENILGLTMNYVNEAKNEVKILVSSSHNMLEICPKETYLAIEPGSPKIDPSKIREDPSLIDSLNSVKTACDNIQKFGDKIKTSLTYEESLVKINERLNKIYDHFKIQEVLDIQSKDEMNLEKITLQHKLIDLVRQNQEHSDIYIQKMNLINNLKSSIDLQNKRILMLTHDLENLDVQINLKSEEIKSMANEGKNMGKFYKTKKQDLKDKYENKINQEISDKDKLKEIIEKKITELVESIQTKKEVLVNMINFIIMIDKSGSMGSCMENVNNAARKFLEN